MLPQHITPFHPQPIPYRPFNPNLALVQPTPVSQQLHPQLNQIMISPRKLQHINCIIENTKNQPHFGHNEEVGEGGLYIGDTISILKADIVSSNQIQAILCCNAEARQILQSYAKIGVETKYLEIEDHIQFPICQFFQQAYEFIENNRKKRKNVLIQCHGGVSRSGTILCAYLMKKENKRLQQIYKKVTKIRNRIKPNLGFHKQLQQFQHQLFNNNSITDTKQQKKQQQQQQFLYIPECQETVTRNENRNKSRSVNRNRSIQINNNDVKAIDVDVSLKNNELRRGEAQGVVFRTPKAGRKGSFGGSQNIGYYSDQKNNRCVYTNYENEKSMGLSRQKIASVSPNFIHRVNQPNHMTTALKNIHNTTPSNIPHPSQIPNNSTQSHPSACYLQKPTIFSQTVQNFNPSQYLHNNYNSHYQQICHPQLPVSIKNNQMSQTQPCLSSFGDIDHGYVGNLGNGNFRKYF